jgi:MFS family permease
MSVFNIIYHTSFLHWHFVVKQQKVVPSFTQEWKFLFSSISFAFLHHLSHLILNSFSFFHPPINYGAIANLVLPLLILIGYRHIKRHLRYKTEEPELKTPVSFTMKILLASLIIGIGLLLFNLSFWIWRSSHIPTDQPLILIKIAAFSALDTYWYAAILVALLTGGILIVINKVLMSKKIVKSEVASEMIKYFKPLFLFYLILTGIFGFVFMITYLPTVITSNEAIKETSIHLYYFLTQFIFPVITLAVIFTPYIIVKERLALKAAFKANFVFWKRHFTKIVTFILFGIGVLFIPLLVDELAGFSFRLSSPLILNLLASIVITALKIFANLIVVAALVIFYSSLTSKEQVSPKERSIKQA